MKKNILLFIVAMIVFLVIDLLWLGVIAQGFYQEHLGELLSDEFKLIPAVIFYITFIIGLVYLVLKPGIDKNSYKQVFIFSILYGIATYGAYDLTNYATMRDFPLLIVVVDLTWGTLLTITTSTISYYIYTRFIK
ncbi:MAG: DUF2177 family protein [Acholeplasma sp.]